MEYNRDDYVYVVAINTKLKVIGGIVTYCKRWEAQKHVAYYRNVLQREAGIIECDVLESMIKNESDINSVIED